MRAIQSVRFTILLLTTMVGCQLHAQFTYSTNIDGTLTITSYSGPGGTVVIPGSIGGLTVTGIGTFAFYNAETITNLSMPDSINAIGDYAFTQCVWLSGVKIPNNVSYIGYRAFRSCFALTNVILPNSLTNIGSQAFIGDQSLISVTIPSGVDTIQSGALSICSALTSVYFKGNVPSVADSTIFAESGNVTVYYLPGTSGWSSTFEGVPAVLWNPQAQTSDGNFGVRSNTFGFNITGTAGIPIGVEANTSLTQSSWVSLFKGTVTNGEVYFSDPQWANYTNRFYRIRSQ